MWKLVVVLSLCVSVIAVVIGVVAVVSFFMFFYQLFSILLHCSSANRNKGIDSAD